MESYQFSLLFGIVLIISGDTSNLNGHKVSMAVGYIFGFAEVFYGLYQFSVT